MREDYLASINREVGFLVHQWGGLAAERQVERITGYTAMLNQIEANAQSPTPKD